MVTDRILLNFSVEGPLTLNRESSISRVFFVLKNAISQSKQLCRFYTLNTFFSLTNYPLFW
jgi:hypothetical protein